MLSVRVRLTAVLLGILGVTAWGQKVETIYSFPADGAKGRRPEAALLLGSDGKLYGTTSEGGSFSAGTAFRITTDGNLELLGNFNPATTGSGAVSPLISIGDGYMYGVTFRNGGAAQNKAGTVYRLDPTEIPSGPEGILEPLFQIPGSGNTTPMDGNWLTSGAPGILHVMCHDYTGIWSVPTSGAQPEVTYFFGDPKVDGYFGNTLIRGDDGYLYGTTSGEYTNLQGTRVYGTIFRIAPDGTGMTTLHEMRWEEGAGPEAALTPGPDGYLYGMAVEGGDGRGDGTIFRISPTGDDYEVVHYFDDLRYPRGQLLYAADGYFYGTANYGGKNAYGGVFRIRPNGSGYKLIHSFNGTDGGASDAALVLGTDGNLYGTTSRGGTAKEGAIFRVLVKLPEPQENRAPVALNDFAFTTGAAVDVDVRANDFDPDSDPLMVSITGAPEHGTAVLVPGGLVRYTPADGYEGEDHFTYSVSDGRGGVATASVAIRHSVATPLVQPGLYNGLLMSDEDLTFEGEVPVGQFALLVNTSGTFTGALFTQSKRFTLRGRFDEHGVARVEVKLGKKTSATLHLSMQAGEPNGVAAVLFGEDPATGMAGRALEGTSGDPASLTLSLHAMDPVAVGHGYGVMKVLPNGAITVKGRLGDGSSFSWGSTAVQLQNGTFVIPVFAESKTATTGGHLVPQLGQPELIGGTVRWIRNPATSSNKPYPAGIDTSVEVSGTVFTAPAKNAPVLDIDGGSVALSNGVVTVAAGEFTMDGKKISTDAPLKSLSINPADGTFSGKITVEGKTVGFNGVVHQELGTGYGHFVVNGVGGQVELVPAARPE